MDLRLKSLKIANWKNLIDLELNFSNESFTSVLVGRNATAKSNLLEALVIIFRDLDLGEKPNFKSRSTLRLPGPRYAN